MAEQSEAASENPDPFNWSEIYRNMPEVVRDWPQNPARKDYLRVGVYVDLPRMRAESWISGLRKVHEEQGRVRLYLGMDNFPTDEPLIRITIVEVPEETMLDAVGRDIVVEAEGVRATISASIFYNCIKGPDKGITDARGTLDGGGWSPPTMGADGWGV